MRVSLFIYTFAVMNANGERWEINYESETGNDLEVFRLPIIALTLFFSRLKNDT